MMELEWKCPFEVPENKQLPFLVSTLVQSGIKLFLHQRNQIPLPLEQLTQKRNIIVLQQHQHSQQEENKLEHDGDDDDNVRERIQLMISKRRQNQSSLRRRRMVDMMSKREELAVESITNCLKILDSQIQTNFQNIVAVGLLFGSSFYTAKEIFLFDLSKILSFFTPMTTNEEQQVEELDENIEKQSQHFVPNLIRSFYKGIIMTDEFCDITAKNLPSTRTHICLLSNKEIKLSQNTFSDKEDLVLLEDAELATNYLSFKNKHNEDFDGDKISTPQQIKKNVRRNDKRKVLQIQIDIRASNNQVSSDQIFNECLFCYQIPLHLKGIISCKNTLI